MMSQLEIIVILNSIAMVANTAVIMVSGRVIGKGIVKK